MKSFFLFTLIAFINCNSSDPKKETGKNEDNRKADSLTTQARPSQTIQFQGKTLTFLQDLYDSSNSLKGKVYVEFIDKDSLFKRLYIFDGNEVKYFVGESTITNFIQSQETAPNYGMRFDYRSKYHLEFFMVGRNGNGSSDPINVEFITSKNQFWDPYYFKE